MICMLLGNLNKFQSFHNILNRKYMYFKIKPYLIQFDMMYRMLKLNIQNMVTNIIHM